MNKTEHKKTNRHTSQNTPDSLPLILQNNKLMTCTWAGEDEWRGCSDLRDCRRLETVKAAIVPMQSSKEMLSYHLPLSWMALKQRGGFQPSASTHLPVVGLHWWQQGPWALCNFLYRSRQRDSVFLYCNFFCCCYCSLLSRLCVQHNFMGMKLPHRVWMLFLKNSSSFRVKSIALTFCRFP